MTPDHPEESGVQRQALEAAVRRFAIGMIVAVLLSASGVILEQLVVTEAEKVTSTIHTIAKDMQTNDVAAVLAHISAGKTELRAYAESVLKRVRVEKVSIKRNLKVVVPSSGAPSTAIAKFNAVARLEDKTSTFGKQTVPRFITLHLSKEGENWRVTDFKEDMPQKGIGR